jgi:hypothetical protein
MLFFQNNQNISVMRIFIFCIRLLNGLNRHKEAILYTIKVFKYFKDLYIAY